MGDTAMPPEARAGGGNASEAPQPPKAFAVTVQPHPSRLSELAALLMSAQSTERTAGLCRIVSRTGVECTGIAAEGPGRIIFDCLKIESDDDGHLSKIRTQYEWTYCVETGILSRVNMVIG